MKKILSFIILSVMLILTFAGCGNTNDTITVGIGQFGEHASLDNCREGFIEGLKQEGFIEGENIEFEYKNASFDTGNCGTISQGFVSDGVELICAIATPMAQAAYNYATDKDIPVVFTAITDPVRAALDTGNVTGTSDMVPVEAQLKLIRTLMPQAKKIGILFTTSEDNSLSTIETYEKLAGDYGFEIVTKGVTNASDVPLAIESIMDEVDCFTNLTDNTVVGQLDIMLEKANAAGKPIFGSEIEQVKNGCVAAQGIDYFALGVQTGKMAAKILNGKATATEMDYETISESFLYVNNEVMAQFGFELPADMEATVVD